MPPASPGHKLGQLIGNLCEEFFFAVLTDFAKEHGLFCDRKGERPAVRGSKSKVTWVDKYGNPHDLDYVLERNGSIERQGDPVAFIELAWRRYTKHSRNKTGEIEGALLPLRETYESSCRFLGAILAGEYSEGGLRQLKSHGITVLYVPFVRVAQAFQVKGLDLTYPENASAQVKHDLIDQWTQLSQYDLTEIQVILKNSIQSDLNEFINVLELSILRQVESIRVLSLFGEEFHFTQVNEAIVALSSYRPTSHKVSHVGFEVYVRFTNDSKVEARFQTKEETIQFLRFYE